MIKKSQFLNLNNFKKLETLERGEFGVILRIEETSTGKIYAAKIPDNVYADKTKISREIEILQLDHPSISKLVGFCPFDFNNELRPVIVTRFYTNRTLQQVLDLKKERKSLPEWTNTKKLINIFGIASGMSFLHANQTIHRDLTPLTILEDNYLYPQISNFSLSQNANQDTKIDSSIKEIFVNSPYYKAPEIFVNNACSFASDVYAFGLVVYEILTDEVPFQNLKTIDILIKVVQQSYRPDIKSKSIPSCYKNLITQCWSQDPRKRPSFNEIVNRLKKSEEFVTSYDVDRTEYRNYVRYVDEYYEKSHFTFSEKSIQKVTLFPVFEKKPLSLNIESIDMSKLRKMGRFGEGTFGTIYEVLNIETGKRYAAKEFKSKIYKKIENEDKISYLKSEVAILKKLNHPAIIKFVGFNPTNFDNLLKPIIFTELVANRSLEAVLQLERNGLADEFWNDTKKLINIYGIASSMTYIHSLNILHRNLKPSNILIDELIHPKLADFGLSSLVSDKLSEDEKELNKKEKFLLGTYAYIAPEIYENVEYSKASDVYAFSLIVYEILTNKKPFFGSTLSQIMMNVTKGFRPEITDEVPKCYKKLIEDCWSQNPRERPTFKEILHILKTDKNFIMENVKQEEFFDYVYRIDKGQSTFDSKVLQIIDFKSIYHKQKVVLITDGFLDLKDFEKGDIQSKNDYSTTYNVIEKESKTVYSAKESNIIINNICKEEFNNLTKDISLISSMNHPYILKLIGYSTVNFDNSHKPVVITEYASDKTLEDYIEMERNGLHLDSWNDTKKLINIYGIAYCMSYLHSHDILHYYLKPSNIMVDQNYHPKVFGFGFHKRNMIQKCLEIQSVCNPKENLAYSIPEVLTSGKYTKASDVYSFALIVYELITNKKPFANFLNDSLYLLKKIENNSFRPEFDDTTPDCYKELIQRCWSQNPIKRPSFDEIVSILKKDTRFITPNINKDEYIEFTSYKYIEPEKYDLQQLMNAAENDNPKALFRFGLLYSKGMAMPLNKKKAARFYEKAASLGYAQAQTNLGKMYLRGYGVPQDKQKALQLFEKAASQGDAKALFNLGVVYFKGNGVEQDYSKAVEYYEKAVDLNDPEAQLNLALMYNNGEGVQIDKKKAFELFSRSAKYGNPVAQFNLAKMYKSGINGFIEKDIDASIRMYQKAAIQGLAEAQFDLALIYLNGDVNVPVNKERAIQLFEKAADQDYEEAKLYLDRLFSKSGDEKEFQIERVFKTVDKKIESIHNSLFTSFFNDFATSLSYIDDVFIEKALSEMTLTATKINHSLKKFIDETSNKSSFPSLKMRQESSDHSSDELLEINKLKLDVQCLEARLNQINRQIQAGFDTEPSVSSPSEAKIRCIIRKAENGDAKSQLALAAFYATGKGGLHANNEKALKYYLMAAEQGNMNAQYAAASYYYYGRGTKEDKNKAFELFSKAAEQGHSKAQFALGHFYQFDMEGVRQDQEMSMKWYKKAAEQGHEAAKHALSGNDDST